VHLSGGKLDLRVVFETCGVNIDWLFVKKVSSCSGSQSALAAKASSIVASAPATVANMSAIAANVSLTPLNASPTSLDGQIIIPDQSKAKGNRVIILPADKTAWSESDILWEWKNTLSAWGKHMSDARRVSYSGKDHILLCGSSGGIALVEVESKKLVYHTVLDGEYNTPHAVALLPDDLIVAADPGDKKGKAAVKLYDIRKGDNKDHVQALEQSGVHGIVWDSKRNCVWAWGGEALHQYSYHSRSLSLDHTYKAPSDWHTGGGHALAPMGSTRLLFSCNKGIGTFDLDSHKFELYDGKACCNTKGIAYNPETKEVIYTHEDPHTGDSRSHYVHSVQKEDRSLKDGIWYKANFYLYLHL